jgi:hypothetical protein
MDGGIRWLALCGKAGGGPFLTLSAVRDLTSFGLVLPGGGGGGGLLLPLPSLPPLELLVMLNVSSSLRSIKGSGESDDMALN